MRIIKEKSREYRGQPYFKYRVNLPWKAVSGAGLKQGDELEFEYSAGKILLKKKESPEKTK